MKSNITAKRVLVFFSLFVFLLLSARSCHQDPEHYHADFHAQGFLDVNSNNIWDEGEPEFTEFTLTITMIPDPEEGTDPPRETVSVIVIAGGVDFSFDAVNLYDASDALDVTYKFNVSNLPDGYIAGSFKEELVSTNKYEQEVDNVDSPGSQTHYYEDYIYEVEIPIQEGLLPTSTPTFTPTLTPTNTSTNTPIPTSTFTPTPSITVSLTGYGTFGGGVDFVKFKLSYAPASGTFSADVGAKPYTCSSSTSDPTVFICEGPAFPSGEYVDVVLYYNGAVIYSGQIFRAVPEKPTKTPEEPQ